MFEKVWLVFVISLSQQLEWGNGFAIVLDQARDVEPSMWRINGDVEFIQDGNNLRDGLINQYLPPNFQYSNMALSRGIWYVVPAGKCNPTTISQGTGEHQYKIEKQSKKEISKEFVSKGIHFKNSYESSCRASGAFKFKLSAQLIDSVNVKYCFGGSNSTIKISKDDKHVFLVLNSENKQMDYWTESYTQVDGNSVLFEASVGGEGDYILIDSITVNTLEPTRKTTTTTEEPTTIKPDPPIPTSGQQGIMRLSSAKFLLIANIILKFY